MEREARLNPNDSNSLIPAVNSLSIYLDGEIGSRYVNIGWDVSGDTENIDGFLIMRKTESAPQNINDGDVVTKVNFGSGQDYNDDDVDSNSDYPQGYVVYYSVFTYTGKYDETGSLELDPDTKEIYNPQNYYFVGPVSGSLSVSAYIDLPVSDDRYMVQFDDYWIDNDIISIVTDNNDTRSIGCVLFDLTGFPADAELESAEFKLSKKDVSSSNDNVTMFISRWDDDWTSTDNYTDLNNMTYLDLEEVQVPYENGAKVSIDVTDTFSSWIDGTYDNYGFRLRSLTVPAVTVYMTFYPSEGGDSGPRLRAFYMY